MKKPLHSLVYPLSAIALILVFNFFLTPGFFELTFRDGRIYGSLIDILNRAVPVALVSLGMTLVIATRGVDLSVGAVMAIAGAVTAVLVAGTPGTPLSWLDVGGSASLAVAVSLLVSLAAGWFNGLLVGRFALQPIIATLILMVAGRGIAQLLTSGQIVLFRSEGLDHLANGAALALPMPIWVLATVALIAVTLVRRTAIGLFVEATGSNTVAAALSGVNTNAVKAFAYATSGVVAGIAGILACANIHAADAGSTGLYLELDAILAVAIGGTHFSGGKFSFAGSLAGAFLMQALTTTILMRGVSPHATLVAKALIIIVVVLFQSATFRRAVRLEESAA